MKGLERKRMLIRKYAPNFIVGFEEPDVTIEPTLQALKSISFIKRWVDRPDYHRLCQSSSDSGVQWIMVELKEGGFWVIARVLEGNLADLGLPEWHPHMEVERAEMPYAEAIIVSGPKDGIYVAGPICHYYYTRPDRCFFCVCPAVALRPGDYVRELRR